MYSNIQDCDEGEMRPLSTSHSKPYISTVFNFWEPLHYLDHGYGFQTWELSPAFAIRSWAYIVLHLWPTAALEKLLSLDKVILVDISILSF